MRAPLASTPRFVAIVGGSGSGKSWLTDRLQKVFGDKAARVSLDDFYRDRSQLSSRRRMQINFDHPRAIDWPMVEQFLRASRSGGPAHLPRYDFKTHTRQSSREAWWPRPLVFMDGLWLLIRPALRKLFDFSIYIDCPAGLRLRRRLERDVAHRGRSRASIQKQFRTAVAPMHERFVAPQIRWADVVIRQPLRDTEVRHLSDQLWTLLTSSALYPAWMRETFHTETRALLKPTCIHE